MHVVVVDDDEIQRTLISAILKNLGYRPVEAADGEQALGLVDALDAPIVVCDLNMPGIDGHAADRAFRRRRHLPLGGGNEPAYPGLCAKRPAMTMMAAVHWSCVIVTLVAVAALGALVIHGQFRRRQHAALAHELSEAQRIARLGTVRWDFVRDEIA